MAFDNYQYHIDILSGYRKQYEGVIEGKTAVIENRIRQYYYDEVNRKISALDMERSMQNKAKSGLESLMIHMYFAGNPPFMSDHDGTPVISQGRVELLPMYDEIRRINVDLLTRYNTETSINPIYYQESKKMWFENKSWLLFNIKESELNKFDYESLRHYVFLGVDSHISKHYNLDCIYSLMPKLHHNSTSEGMFFEWQFILRCVALNKI